MDEKSQCICSMIKPRLDARTIIGFMVAFSMQSEIEFSANKSGLQKTAKSSLQNELAITECRC
eukprot:SAG31_NODE_1613_length_7743_cov_5.584903_2_plen_63_part_00